MRRTKVWLRALTVWVSLGVAGSALAAGAPGSCEREASWVPSGTVHHYLVLAASKGVFYNQSGPSFVMLMKTNAATDETEMGAVGIYADDKGRPRFGTVPWQTYDAFLQQPAKRESGKKASADKPQKVMLRLEINEPQYDRVLTVLRTWERRAGEDALLYPDDLFMNNILLVKAATEQINRCKHTVNVYDPDWGVNDEISDNNPAPLVPYLVFREIARRNAGLNVPDSKMPEGLASLPGTQPLAARAPDSAHVAVIRTSTLEMKGMSDTENMHDMHKPAAAAH